MSDTSHVELIEALSSSDKPTVRAAVDALIPLLAGSAGLKETLNALLLNAQRKNRWAVAYVLAHLPQPPSKTIEILLDGLGHRDPEIRWAIGLLLVRLAKTENKIVQSLSELCATGSSAQKRMALYCLRDLNLNDKASLQVLLASLRDSDATVRVAATIGLRTRFDFDVNDRKILLQVFLDDPDSRVRNAAALTLSQWGSPSEEVLTALKKASEGDNPQLKKAAASALAILENKKARSTR